MKTKCFWVQVKDGQTVVGLSGFETRKILGKNRTVSTNANTCFIRLDGDCSDEFAKGTEVPDITSIVDGVITWA